MPQPRSIFHTQSPKRAVYNNSSSDIGPHLGVMTDTDGVDYVKLPTGATVAVLGFTGREGIPKKSWGSLIVEPGCTIPAVNAGGVTQGQRLGIDTAGKVVTIATTAGDNHAYVGVANEDASTGEVGEIIFAGPGLSIQGDD